MDEETKTDTKKKEKRVDLSLAQVAGSALAAAVAAYLAGRLGVYGTIIGAGVVSVVATTGGSVFQHLFRRTGEQLKEATVTTRPKPRRFSATTRSTAGEAHRADPTMVLPTFDKQGAEDDVTSVAARRTGPDTDRTQLIPRAEAVHRRDPAGAHPLPDADATRRLPGRAAAEASVSSPEAGRFAGADGAVDSAEAGDSDETRVLRPAYAGAPTGAAPRGADRPAGRAGRPSCGCHDGHAGGAPGRRGQRRDVRHPAARLETARARRARRLRAGHGRGDGDRADHRSDTER
jgi:hypothetical protein